MRQPAGNTGVCNQSIRKTVAALFSAALVLAGMTGSTTPSAASEADTPAVLEPTPRQTSTRQVIPDNPDDDAAESAPSAAPVKPAPRQESSTQPKSSPALSPTPSATSSEDPEEEDETTEIEPEETEATITVRVGGDRSGGNTLAGLGGVSLRLHADGASGPGAAIAESWARCTSNSAGDCSFTIPDTHPATDDYDQGDNYDRRFWVVQESVPAGWYANPTAGLSSQTPYQFRTGSALRAGKTYTSNGDFMHTEGSTGTWQNSRANPSASLSCTPGLSIALVIDRSGPVGNVPQLGAAAEAMQQRVAGSNSTVTVIDSSTTGGLGQVAAGSYDLAIVVGTGGSVSNFAAFEHLVGAANTVKAKGTKILAIGLGPASSANLRAIAGPQTSGSAAYTGADVHTIGIGRLGALLDSIADQVTCETTIELTQKLTAYGQETALAGAGWGFSVESSNASVTPQATQNTDKHGTVTYGVDFASSKPAKITVSSLLTEQQRAEGWATTQATCDINGNDAPLNKTTAELSIKPGDRVECTFHAEQTLESSLKVSAQAWDTDNIGGLAQAPELPPGSSIPAGKIVTWTYRVTNTGETPLDDIVVTDSQLPDDAVVCPASTLAAGKTMTCTATGAVTADH